MTYAGTTETSDDMEIIPHVIASRDKVSDVV
jgi:hypothetical protein